MTLNQIIKQIKSFGQNHPQIKFVWFGDIMEKLDDEDVTYPAMFIDINSIGILEKQIQYSFDIYLMDRHLQETQAEEILSDMVLISQDMVANFRNQIYEWTTDNNISTEIFRESTPDYLAGLKMTIPITLSSLNDTCIIPN